MTSLLKKFSLFISWWLEGLSYFFPESLKKKLGIVVDKITIQIDEKQITYKHYPYGKNQPILTQSLDLDDDIQRITIKKWLERQISIHTSLVLLVPDEFCLNKEFTLPEAVQSNLREAISYEMSKHTPFTIDKAYFDFDSFVSNENKINIKLTVAPKNRVDHLLDKLNEIDIHPDEVKPFGNDLFESNINLLGEDERKANNRGKKAYLIHIMATCAFILSIAVLYTPLYLQSKTIASIEEIIDQNRKAAVSIKKLESEKKTIQNQLNFMQNKQKETIANISLLKELTEILPDHTWLTRLVVKGTNIQVHGLSRTASSLVQIIESSKQFKNAKFISPVTQDRRTGKDKFQLSANLIKTEEPAL